MGYKLLGFAVWKGAKWYLGRRASPKAGLKAAAAGGALLLAAGMAGFLLRRVGRG
jgi:hypothetical protein